MKSIIIFDFNNLKTEMKALKTILKNDDILARYKLICLWSIDQFINSLPEPDDSLNIIINKTLLDTNETAQTPEEIHSTLMSIKKVLQNQVDKLETIQQHTKNLNIILKLIEGVDKNETNDLTERIANLKTYITRIDNLSISDINQLIDSVQ